MKIRVNFIYILLIAFLIILLILGHQINKQNSASKKNEISNIVNQLKTRNNQLAKIQKNLFEEGKNLNDIINKKGITFENIFKDKKLDGLNNFSYSKYSTKDILFNGNRGATGTAYIDFYNNDKNLLIATYDGIFAFTNLNNLENFVKINSNINSIIKYDKFYFHEQYGIKDIHIDNNKLYVSYIGERKDNCYDLKIIFSELNEKFLDFSLFYQTLNCVDKNNNHGFWAHQGAGGRIVNLDNSNEYPDSLKKAVRFFIYGVANGIYYKDHEQNKARSMFVHTSAEVETNELATGGLLLASEPSDHVAPEI